MLKVFISSHGHFASGIKSSADILLGSSNNLTAFDAYVDQSSVEEHLTQFLSTVSEDDQVFLLSDIHCGSVNQAMYQYLDRPNTTIITGINLSLVLELLSNDTLSPEEVDEIVSSSREMLHVVKAEIEPENHEDFF